MKSELLVMGKDTILDQLCERYPSLLQIRGSVGEAATALITCFESGGKLLICGNGGSSADSLHTAGELMKNFELKRPLSQRIRAKLAEVSPERGTFIGRRLEAGLPAISLTANNPLITAISNDIDPDLIFAQQIIALGKSNDVLIAVSTSGNSRNITDACITARALGMKVTGITGKNGGRMKDHCDILVNVPEESTALIQELHLPVLHAICRIVEGHFFNKENAEG